MEWQQPCSLRSLFLKKVHAVSLPDQEKMQQKTKSKMLRFCLSANSSLNLNMWSGCDVCRIFTVHTCTIKKGLQILQFLLCKDPSLAEYLLSRSTSACPQQLRFCWKWKHGDLLFLKQLSEASRFTSVFLYPSAGPYPDATSTNPSLSFLLNFSPVWQWLSFSAGGWTETVLGPYLWQRVGSACLCCLLSYQ